MSESEKYIVFDFDECKYEKLGTEVRVWFTHWNLTVPTYYIIYFHQVIFYSSLNAMHNNLWFVMHYSASTIILIYIYPTTVGNNTISMHSIFKPNISFIFFIKCITYTKYAYKNSYLSIIKQLNIFYNLKKMHYPYKSELI